MHYSIDAAKHMPLITCRVSQLFCTAHALLVGSVRAAILAAVLVALRASRCSKGPRSSVSADCCSAGTASRALFAGLKRGCTPVQHALQTVCPAKHVQTCYDAPNGSWEEGCELLNLEPEGQGLTCRVRAPLWRVHAVALGTRPLRRVLARRHWWMRSRGVDSEQRGGRGRTGRRHPVLCGKSLRATVIVTSSAVSKSVIVPRRHG